MMVIARNARRIARVFGVAVVTVSALLCSPGGSPSASAVSCPDVEAVFARGTFEPPGVGETGQDFVDTLRSRIGGKSLNVYPVKYPASTDFPTAADGVIDASNHVRNTAAKCPDTKMVLGGYSQGAAVIGYVTAPEVPKGYKLPQGLSGPMPPEVANHVAAVALLGKPSSKFLDKIDAPPIVIGPKYADKTIDLCASGDPICSAGGDNDDAHQGYAANGMTSRAADFAAQHL
jgi:cutinase